MNQKIKALEIRASELRLNPTLAESKLLKALSENKSRFPDFEFQKVIYPFIADFAFDGLKLIVEVDGGVHEQKKSSDSIRDGELQRNGYKVLRFSNGEVIVSIEDVLRQIEFECLYRVKRDVPAPPLAKKKMKRPMVVPLPRVVFEEPISAPSRTKAGKVRLRKAPAKGK